MKIIALLFMLGFASNARAVIAFHDVTPAAIEAQIQYKSKLVLAPPALGQAYDDERWKQLQEIGMTYPRLLDVLRYANSHTAPEFTVANA